MATVKYNLGTVKNGNNYSTDEQVVGTWIDGKPLYRKVLLCTTNTTLSNRNSYNIRIQGWSETSNLNIKDYVSINFSSISYGERIDYTIRDDKSIEFWCIYSSFDIKAGSPMIIEYTKTTDV